MRARIDIDLPECIRTQKDLEQFQAAVQKIVDVAKQEVLEQLRELVWRLK